MALVTNIRYGWYLHCKWRHPGHLLPWFTFQLTLLTNYTSFICFLFYIFSLCAFYFALCALCNKRHLTWVPGVALCQLWNILAAAAAILTCLLSWLERPNSSNSLPPTTGKFGRNSLLRTIFKFLRLLSSAGAIHNDGLTPALSQQGILFFTNTF